MRSGRAGSRRHARGPYAARATSASSMPPRVGDPRVALLRLGSAAAPSCAFASSDRRAAGPRAAAARRRRRAHAGAPCARASSTSPICSRSLATIGLPSPMYSKSFVGEPTNRVPSAFRTCGETQTSQLASSSSALLVRDHPGHVDDVAKPAAADLAADLVEHRAVPDQHPARFRPSGGGRLDHRRQLPHPVPEAEGPDESDGRRLLQPAPLAPRVRRWSRSGSNRSTSTPLGLTRIRPDRLPTPRAVAHRVGDHDQQVGVRHGRAFDLLASRSSGTRPLP